MNKPNKNKHIDTVNRVAVTRGEGWQGDGKMDKGGQLHGDEWKLNLWE